MQLADSFMDLPAWGFWGVVIAVVGIPIGIWAARSGERQARLYCELIGTAQLVSQPDKHARQLGVSWDGVAIEDPHLTTLHLALRSRRDIREDAFAKGEGFVINVGAPIVAVLRQDYVPADGPSPRIAVASAGDIEVVEPSDRGIVRIGPDLIHRDAEIRLALVTEGAPRLKRPQRTLIDVELCKGPPPNPVSNVVILSKWALGIFIVATWWYLIAHHTWKNPLWMGAVILNLAIFIWFGNKILELTKDRKKLDPSP